jgi:hypothetical protein
MLCLLGITLEFIVPLVSASFLMYHTDWTEERQYSDCLYFYHSYMDRSDSWELFPYCVRYKNERLHECFRGQSVTFGQLKEKQIHSTSLLAWNIPVEIIDAYLSLDVAFDNEFICNCTSGYFGPRCEYSLDFSVPVEFKDLISLSTTIVTSTTDLFSS